MRTISLKGFNTIGLAVTTILLVCLFSISLLSCKKDGKENNDTLCPVVAASAVPQVVKDSFSIRYSATSVITWFNKDSVAFCAFFIDTASIEKLVQFANNGSFIKEEVEIQQDGQHEDSTVTGGKVTVGCECETHTHGD